MDSKMVTLSVEELEKLADFLQRTSGIKMSAEKLQRFKRKIVDVFVSHNIEDFSQFYHKIKHLHDEKLIQDLTNAVTVNETYFWREHEQFEILTKDVLPKYLQIGSINTIRILVSPCSSGEELYSIMLAILGSGNLLEKLNIELVGIDIDSKMIHKAKSGLYTKRSVEKLSEDVLKSYFTKIGTLYKIDENLTANATFMQVNIFDAEAVAKLGKFDIVFSRNMLIYFNEEDKQKCFFIFHKLLKKDGHLFLGHADANSINKNLFSTLKRGSHLYLKR